MHIAITRKDDTEAPRTFPYLALDSQNRVCLVGRFAIIILEDGGNGYIQGCKIGEAESYVKNLAGIFKVPRGLSVTLSQ